MFRPVRFPDSIEPLVRFVEETSPEDIVEETVAKLAGGTGVEQVMQATALAVIRCTEMPYVHHGGPLHPVAALHAVEETMRRLPEEMRLLPLVQDVALANGHIHDPASGPYVLPEISPLGEGSVEATREAFFDCLRRNYPSRAEHYFLWLLEHAPQEVALEALVRVAVANYRFDEHKLIAAVNGIRLLESIGWSLASVVLRPVVRYNFMPSVWANAPPADRVERLVERYGLEEGGVPKGEDEGQEGEVLRRELLERPLEEQSEVIARTLAGGLSLEEAGEAISLAASEAFVGSDTTNPMGIHSMTGANALRWVCRRFPALGARGLLLWGVGPETAGGKGSAAPSEERPPAPVSLEAIHEAIGANDPARTVAFTQAYCKGNGDAAALLQGLGEWAAKDSSTEMHGMKHHQAMAEEFSRTRAASASVHLVAQAKEAALHAGKGTEVYGRAVEALERCGVR